MIDMAKKRGRPKLKASERRDIDLRVPLTKAEHAQVKRDAGDASIAEYVRSKLGLS